MKKALLFAGLLSGAVFIAAGSSAQSNDVEVKLTIDRADSAAITYAKVQEEAGRVCLKDTHCKAALVEALVAEINDAGLYQLHAEHTGSFDAYQVAAADQG